MKHLNPILAICAVSVAAAAVCATVIKSDHRPLDRYGADSSSKVRVNAHAPEKVSARQTVRMMHIPATTPLYTWDFSGCSAGSEEEPDAVEIGALDWSTFAEGPIDSQYTGEEGWSGMGVFQAGGMIMLDPKATGLGMADITTPVISVPETFTVRVKVRATADAECNIHFAAITPNPKDDMMPDMKQTNNPISGEWKTVNATFQYNEAHDDLTLQIIAMNPMLIDTIEVLPGEATEDSDYTEDADITHPEDAEIIIDEDFSLFTEGSVEEPSEKSLTEDWVIDSRYTKQPGWSGINVSMAGGAAALVNNLNRCLNTCPSDLSGHVTVTFRVYGYESITALYCSLMREPYSTNPELLGQRTSHIRTKDRWTWVRYEFDNTDGSEDCYIQIRPFAKCLIDDIKVSTQNTLIAQPRLLPASDFTIDGFTANWGNVKKAEDYLLSVYKEEPSNPGETSDCTESFESMADGTLPAGWDFNVGETATAAEASEGSVSVKLTENYSSIDLPSNGGRFLSLSIDGRAFGEKDQMDFYNAHLYMEKFDGYRWQEVNGYWVFPEDKWVTFNMDSEATGAYRVRLGVRNLSEGEYILIDNVRWTTTSETERLYVLEDEVLTGTSRKLEGLDTTGDYFYTVKARNKSLDLVSDVTGAMDAFGVAAPVATEATELSARGAFTANWENVPKATTYGIKTYSLYTADQEEPEHTVLEETFSGTYSTATPEAPESLGNMDLIPLDGLTDNNGWYGFLTIACQGGLGAMSLPDYGVKGELQSPELSLSNNGGTCHVEIVAYGVPGDRVDVINNAARGLAMEGYGTFMEYYGDIPNCTENDILTFYSEQFQNFFINSIKVIQHLEEGDKVVTLLSTKGNPTESYRATGLDPEMDYAYDVYSRYTRYYSSCTSPLSNRIYVMLAAVGTDRVGEEQTAVITQLNDILTVDTPSPVRVTVTGMDGINAVDALCPEGRSELRIPGRGVYVVSAGDRTMKILVE